MVFRRRRYQSLGILKQSHSDRQPLEGVQKFVSESQINDVILFTRVTRARPGLNNIEFPDDDVDWPVEYVCNAIGAWITGLVGWILSILEFFMRFLGFKRKDDKDKDDKDAAPDGATTRKKSTESRKINSSGGDAPENGPEVIWRYENCIPFMKRRPVKRKWFKNPNTKAWAEERTELFMKHVNRGFRSLCSSVGKDTRIYVVASPEDQESTPQTYVFRADSSILAAHSELFCQWFSMSGDRKIVTSLVTPKEMQAILVYIYTLTWPTDMMVKTGKSSSLDLRFQAILALHGISLSLEKVTPPVAPDQRLPIIAEEEEEAPGSVVDLSLLVVDEKNDNVTIPVKKTSSIMEPKPMAGQGDFTNSEIPHYVNHGASQDKSLTESHSAPSDRRGSEVEIFRQPHHPLFSNSRVYPETFLSQSHEQRVGSRHSVRHFLETASTTQRRRPFYNNNNEEDYDSTTLSRMQKFGFHVG